MGGPYSLPGSGTGHPVFPFYRMFPHREGRTDGRDAGSGMTGKRFLRKARRNGLSTNSDFGDLLRIFAQAGVEYLVVGA